VGGGGAVVPGDHPLLLPTPADRPGGGLPTVGRVPGGGHVSVLWGREEGAPLTVLVMLAVRAALPHHCPLSSPPK
jgi:hypothetical protein